VEGQQRELLPAPGGGPISAGRGEEAPTEGTEAQEIKTEAEEENTGTAEVAKAEPPKGRAKQDDSQGEDKAGELAVVPAVPAEPVSRERCAVQPLEAAKLREGCRFMVDNAETRVSASVLAS